MLKNVPVLVIFISYLALMGCGTKGPLYIPEQRYPQGANNSAPKNLKQHALKANIHEVFHIRLSALALSENGDAKNWYRAYI